jgi:RimJ/RimL family protein N-acetyltransferase
MNIKKMKHKSIYFKLVEVDDAAFILSLRLNGKYNKHISLVQNDLQKQKQWLTKYKEKELSKEEYYFIVHRNIDDERIGTVRLYDFIKDEDSFSWGSWILNEKKTRYAALECALLIYDYTFLKLKFKRCHMDMRKSNHKIIEFHKKLGAKIVGETKDDYLAHYYLEDYLNVRKDLSKTIESL